MTQTLVRKLKENAKMIKTENTFALDENLSLKKDKGACFHPFSLETFAEAFTNHVYANRNWNIFLFLPMGEAQMIGESKHQCLS